jgi:hypothetical protein
VQLREHILRVLSEQRITHMMVVPQLLTVLGQTLDQQLREHLLAPAYRLMAAVANRIGFSARRRCISSCIANWVVATCGCSCRVGRRCR